VAHVTSDRALPDDVSPTSIAVRRILNRLSVRVRRGLQVLRIDARPGLRRELLTIDYVLPLVLRRGGTTALRLRARSRSAAGTLYFGRESFAVDRVAYFGIFLEGWYRADYHGATVIDIGAHKGYFGAYAMLEGANEVHSFEPESVNFAALERAAESFGPRWAVHRAAIGSAAGHATLHVSAESAGHSIVIGQSEGPRRTLRSEPTRVRAMSDVVARAPNGRPLIVKIDAEGAECDIVLGTPVEVWRRVDRMFLEFHRFAPCSSRAIIARLRGAGLELALHAVDEDEELLVLAR
jgi:FkbM family methyltransferase